MVGRAPPVRDARVEECGEIARLERRFFPEHAFSRSQILRYRRRPRTFVLVAAGVGGRVEGYLVGSVHERGLDRTLYIVSMAVVPGWRRRGLGRRLLETAIARGRSLGARRVALEVAARSRGTRAFYRRLGFEAGRTLPDYYGVGRDALRMARDA